MGCCDSNDDVEMMNDQTDGNDISDAGKKQCGCSCGGTGGCGIKMWIVVAIVVAAIWYIMQL